MTVAEEKEIVRLKLNIANFLGEGQIGFWQHPTAERLRDRLMYFLQKHGYDCREKVRVNTKFGHALSITEWKIDILVLIQELYIPIILQVVSLEDSEEAGTTEGHRFRHVIYPYWRAIYQLEKIARHYRNMPTGFAILLTDNPFCFRDYSGPAALLADSEAPKRVDCSQQHATLHIRGNYPHTWESAGGAYRFLLTRVKKIKSPKTTKINQKVTE